MARGKPNGRSNGDTVGFEAKLWQAADALRNNMDAAEYKHVALGLIFLKYISDAFEAKHAELEAQRADGADPEDPDEYRADNIFWVPPEARWPYLKGIAPQPTIGQIVDAAMDAIERDNPSLKGVLPKDYARPGLDKARLGQLINLVSDIGLGSPADRSRDVLGRVYEYFLSQFASAEGKKGGQFYTPSMSCACWSRCWRRTRAASTIRAAAPAACSCRARNSSRRIAAASATSRSTARNRITRPGGSPR
jgi:type I restriction enzyme M protein